MATATLPRDAHIRQLLTDLRFTEYEGPWWYPSSPLRSNIRVKFEGDLYEVQTCDDNAHWETVVEGLAEHDAESLERWLSQLIS